MFQEIEGMPKSYSAWRLARKLTVSPEGQWKNSNGGGVRRLRMQVHRAGQYVFGGAVDVGLARGWKTSSERVCTGGC
jgi:hypothetical protein